MTSDLVFVRVSVTSNQVSALWESRGSVLGFPHKRFKWRSDAPRRTASKEQQTEAEAILLSKASKQAKYTWERVHTGSSM